MAQANFVTDLVVKGSKRTFGLHSGKIFDSIQLHCDGAGRTMQGGTYLKDNGRPEGESPGIYGAGCTAVRACTMAAQANLEGCIDHLSHSLISAMRR